MADQNDYEIATKTVRIENKTIFVDLRQNSRGKYLKISEKTGTKKSSIIIPAGGLDTFFTVLNDVRTASDDDLGDEQQQIATETMNTQEQRPKNLYGDAETAANRVIVNNLSWATTSEMLQEHMASAGTIVEAQILTKKGGKSQGRGVVEFSSVEEVEKAIEKLSKSEIDGRPIAIRKVVRD